MPAIPKHNISLGKHLLWKTVLIGLILTLLSQAVILWLISAKETDDAFSSGRRFVIALDSDAINGKIISSLAISNPQSNNQSEEKNIPTKDPSNDNTKKTNDTTKDQSKKSTQHKNINNKISFQKNEELILPAITPSNNPPAGFSIDMAEKTEFGFLPKISNNGTKPWKYYSKPITINSSKPMISIIVTGLGKNKNINIQALRLPEAINLSFSPYSKNLKSWMVSSRLSGHETLLDLPMEESNYPASDPGPLGLLVSKEQQQNESRIKKLMAKDAGYVGFISPKNEAFLENNELFKSLLKILSGRGLMLVVGKKPPKDVTKEMIEKGNTASIIIDNVIDEELTTSAINAHLSLLEQTAKQRGYAVGIAHGYPITIKQLNEWSAKADENGFNLVPVSVIISKRF